jgi:hypothetical protein
MHLHQHHLQQVIQLLFALPAQALRVPHLQAFPQEDQALPEHVKKVLPQPGLPGQQQQLNQPLEELQQVQLELNKVVEDVSTIQISLPA